MVVVPCVGGPLRDAQEELGGVRGQRPVRGVLRGLGLRDRQTHRHQVQDLHRSRREVRRQGPGDEDLERDGRGAGVRGEDFCFSMLSGMRHALLQQERASHLR